MNTQTTTSGEPRDEKLWKAAKRRVEFKKHLLVYILINTFLWAIWFFTGADYNGPLPWPAYASIGWGIGLFFNYINAYSGFRDTMLENEYRKLQQKQAGI